MKILVLHPDFEDPGGVSAYYKKLESRYTFPVDHFVTGKRPLEKGDIAKITRLIKDYWNFLTKIKKDNYDVIHVNPSLDPRSFFRDGMFLLLARMHKKKTVVFFHGWQETFARKIQNNGMWRFKYLYGKVDAFIVLAEEFKKTLESWGCPQPVIREVIVIDDDILKEFDIHQAIEKRIRSEKWRILFLSRILREKGIYETIEAVSILGKKYPQIELIIAGDGEELENIKTYVHKNSISNVIFAGYVVGEEKCRLLEGSHILCFPTYYSEGFPNTIVESMAFGIPVVTRPVGGIADFFKNGEHGFTTTSKEPGDFANSMEKLFLDVELYRKISMCNYRYAIENFLASQAASRLGKIYKSVLEK
jgi:glycosyltransferase involved in cell wall biosynthesis